MGSLVAIAYYAFANPQAVKTSDDKHIKTLAKEDQCSIGKQNRLCIIIIV
jgi:hypothetical protein